MKLRKILLYTLIILGVIYVVVYTGLSVFGHYEREKPSATESGQKAEKDIAVWYPKYLGVMDYSADLDHTDPLLRRRRNLERCFLPLLALDRLFVHKGGTWDAVKKAKAKKAKKQESSWL